MIFAPPHGSSHTPTCMLINGRTYCEQAPSPRDYTDEFWVTLAIAVTVFIGLLIYIVLSALE